MKNLFNKFLAILIVVTFVIPAFAANVSAAAEDSVFFIRPDDNPGLTFSVGSYEKSSRESYMFLPKTVDASSVTVRYSGTFSNVTGAAVTEWNSEEKTITVDTTAATAITAGTRRLYFMQSVLPSMSIVLNEGESMDTINADKEARIGAKVSIDGTDGGTYDLAPLAIEMKTRGNTTFWPDKKPYQIKFDKKQDLFGMGKAKKWILLANYYDGTSVRTKVFFDLADEIGLEYSGKSTFVDLYIDGDYRGVYQITEKIEIGSTRVDLKDEYGVVLEMEDSTRTDVVNDIFFNTNYALKDIVYKDYVYDFEDMSTPERVAKIYEIRNSVEGRINAFDDLLNDRRRFLRPVLPSQRVRRTGRLHAREHLFLSRRTGRRDPLRPRVGLRQSLRFQRSDTQVHRLRKEYERQYGRQESGVVQRTVPQPGIRQEGERTL